jgi:hypothetical protein
MTEPLAPWELEHVKRRVAAASPALWYPDAARGLVTSDGKVIARIGAGFEQTPQDAANGDFIGHARADVPGLLATLDEYQALAAWVAQLDPSALAALDAPYGNGKEMRQRARCSACQRSRELLVASTGEVCQEPVHAEGE